MSRARRLVRKGRGGTRLGHLPPRPAWRGLLPRRVRLSVPLDTQPPLKGTPWVFSPRTAAPQLQCLVLSSAHLYEFSS